MFGIVKPGLTRPGICGLVRIPLHLAATGQSRVQRYDPLQNNLYGPKHGPKQKLCLKLLDVLLQVELETMRRVGRPKGSRDKKTRVRKSIHPQKVISVLGDLHQTSQSPVQGPCNRFFADCNTGESSDNRARREKPGPKNSTSWIDQLSFAADSDPFRCDWPHW